MCILIASGIEGVKQGLIEDCLVSVIALDNDRAEQGASLIIKHPYSSKKIFSTLGVYQYCELDVIHKKNLGIV